MTKIAVLVGSLQKNSVNLKLAKSLEGCAEGRLEFEYVDLNLPLFNQDLEGEAIPEVENARNIVKGADAVLLVSPEYNRGITGVLKNAIDWLSRPYGAGVIQGKKVGIVGATLGTLGTGPSQAHLRSIVGYLNMPLMGQPEYYLSVTPETFGDDGLLKDMQYTRKYIDSFVEFVK